jgi:acetoin utilization deacetylase AcuC-like enzyme
MGYNRSSARLIPGFAVNLHPSLCETSKQVEQIKFAGHSYPHFKKIRIELAKALAEYPTLAIRNAEYNDYLRVHTKSYIDKLLMMASGSLLEEQPKLSIECTGFEHCLPGYLYGLGGMLESIDQMRIGALERSYCFCLGGHHAYADWGHGYCLLNPLAATARYAQMQGFEKILIVDWDIHHGDGTQSIFTNDSNIYCISIHSAIDLYMALMKVLRNGTTTAGENAGHCNIPLLDKCYDDAAFEKLKLTGKFYRSHESLTVFHNALEELPWTPDLILIFSGYDSHKDDCGKDITDWSEAEYMLLTRYVLGLAKHAACPVLSVHGGGYNIQSTISSAIRHVDVLATYR